MLLRLFFHRILLLFFIFSISLISFAGNDNIRNLESKIVQQSRKIIRGVVTDTDGNALIGVNVIETGTTNGTVTDIEGVFELILQEESSKLSFSYIGFSSQIVNLNGRSIINVTPKSLK